MKLSKKRETNESITEEIETKEENKKDKYSKSPLSPRNDWLATGLVNANIDGESSRNNKHIYPNS